MPGKWKVYVVSQKRSAKARSNWRSLCSYVSWFNKVSKKVLKPASLMMFLMLGDNDAHAFFNIWRLPLLLRLCNTKVQLINFHDQNPHDQKFSITKKNSQNQCPTKILPQPKFFTCPYTATKFFHSHAKRKNSYMTKIKIPTSSCPCTNKFLHSQNHNHTNFPRINITYPTKFFHKSKFHARKVCPYLQIYPQNFTMSIKQSLHMPANFSHMHHEHIHLSLQHKFFTMPTLSKPKPKFIQQHHNLPTLSKIPWATNIVQIALWLNNNNNNKIK